MSEKLTIALDAMGGDHGPGVVLPAARRILQQHDSVTLVAVGDQAILAAEIQKLGLTEHPRLRVQHASQAIAMDESPAQAIRTKKDSSMRVAINLVKQGDAHACVSAGNTGALMAISRFVLKTLPGIDRPAIITSIPAIGGHTWVLDLGANVDSTADHLLQFAIMGSVLAAAADGVAQPRVGLLNVGEEDNKGNEQVKQAHGLISASALNYIGFVEGDDIYKDTVDVVVCDGFVGNIALKSSEGVAKMITHYMRQEFSKSLFSKLAALVAMPVLKAFRRRFDPRRYNGATLVGLKGVVVKSHGGADTLAFSHAIDVAILEASKRVPERIHQELETILLHKEAV